ncbi:unnamed protein product, partial [Rotaria sp. Silwood1]
MRSLPIVQNATLSAATISTEIFAVIAPIRPDWNSSNTRLVTFPEGLTNTMMGLFDNRTPNDESQALVIKIFGAQTELFMNRQIEIEAMGTLAEHGVIAQRCLIQFNNGIIYEYVPGIPCLPSDLIKEHIAPLVAAKMGHMHSIPMEQNKQPFIVTLLQ